MCEPSPRRLKSLTSAALQYKPSRWWFEFALLYNKIFFVLLSVLLNSDARAWHLLGSLVALTVATLVLVAVDRPFRAKADQDGATLGDKLMLVSLASQLINYGVAAECLQHKEERLEAGLDGMSDEVTLNAALVGFLLVGVQVAGVVYAYLDEKVDDKISSQIDALEMAFMQALGEAEAQGLHGEDMASFVRARVTELTGSEQKEKKSKKTEKKKAEKKKAEKKEKKEKMKKKRKRKDAKTKTKKTTTRSAAEREPGQQCETQEQAYPNPVWAEQCSSTCRAGNV